MIKNALPIHFFAVLALSGAACQSSRPIESPSGVGSGKADGAALVLNGDDAVELMNLLASAGSSVGVAVIEGAGSRFLTAYDLRCIGHNYQNQCYVSAQDIDPAWSRADIADPLATRVWILLKRAGAVSEISNRSDGTAGKTILTGGTVQCTDNPDIGQTTCTIDPGATLPSPSEHALTGNDARALVQVLSDAGASVGLRKIDASELGAEFFEAYSILCIGKDFHNICYASSQNIEPAMSRATLSDPAATVVWQLLTKAGLEFEISNRSDGTNGKAVLVGGALRCTLRLDIDLAECYLSSESR